MRLNLARFFKVTGLVLVVVAAGLVMTAFHTANEAGWLTVGQTQAFDLSWLVRPGTPVSSLLTGVLGIQPFPVWIEVIALARLPGADAAAGGLAVRPGEEAATGRSRPCRRRAIRPAVAAGPGPSFLFLLVKREEPSIVSSSGMRTRRRGAAAAIVAASLALVASGCSSSGSGSSAKGSTGAAASGDKSSTVKISLTSDGCDPSRPRCRPGWSSST